MSPDPSTLLDQAARYQQKALATRGTKANPAYLPIDVDLLTTMVEQAIAEWGIPLDMPDDAPMFRFVAEHILGLHIDQEKG